MKRRALIVGSALASVGALLGVGKASEEANLPERIQIKNPDPIAALGIDPMEAQLAAIREQPWYQDLLKQRVMEQMYPLHSMNLVSRSRVTEAMGMSGYEIQQLLDPPAAIRYALPTDRVINQIVTDPSPEWIELNENEPYPKAYRLSGPDSRRAGI